MKIKPIRTREDLTVAKETLANLIRKNVDGAKDDEIEVLSILVERFERADPQLEPPSPISAIKFRMEEMGMSARQIEPFIGSRARVSEVLTGKRSLSIDMIRALHEGLGIPYASLISRRVDSNEKSLDEVQAPAIERLNSLGFDISKNGAASFVQTSLIDYAPSALLRKTKSQRTTLKTDKASLLLWQAALLKKASNMKRPARFDRQNFTRDFLRRLSMLSTKPNGPREAINALATKGVMVVVLPALPGTFLDGAAMLTPVGIPIIGLTLRHDRTDNFWFTLLHEACHLHLHYGVLEKDKTAFVDDMEIESEDIFEQEADRLARLSLIPDSIVAQVRWDEGSAAEDISAVASRARVHRSVVAGRWQKDHRNYRKFARLIERGVVRPMLAQT